MARYAEKLKMQQLAGCPRFGMRVPLLVYLKASTVVCFGLKLVERNNQPCLSQLTAADRIERKCCCLRLLAGMQDVLLAVRILTALGRIHAVIFHDPQPAVIMKSNLRRDIEVSMHVKDFLKGIKMLKSADLRRNCCLVVAT